MITEFTKWIRERQRNISWNILGRDGGLVCLTGSSSPSIIELSCCFLKNTQVRKRKGEDVTGWEIKKKVFWKNDGPNNVLSSHQDKEADFDLYFYEISEKNRKFFLFAFADIASYITPFPSPKFHVRICQVFGTFLPSLGCWHNMWTFPNMGRNLHAFLPRKWLRSNSGSTYLFAGEDWGRGGQNLSVSCTEIF